MVFGPICGSYRFSTIRITEQVLSQNWFSQKHFYFIFFPDSIYALCFKKKNIAFGINAWIRLLFEQTTRIGYRCNTGKDFSTKMILVSYWSLLITRGFLFYEGNGKDSTTVKLVLLWQPSLRDRGKKYLFQKTTVGSWVAQYLKLVFWVSIVTFLKSYNHTLNCCSFPFHL